MVEVYFYLSNDRLDYSVECGLKLSEWAGRQSVIEGSVKKCIVALLNPKDDMEKFKSDIYTCIKMRVENRYCYAAEGCLYKSGLKSDKLMKEYEKSIIPAENYVFGTYRQPEFLVTTTVVGGNISILNKKMDSPFLYSSSEELYINNTVEEFKEKYSDFNNNILYYLLDNLSCGTSRYEKIVDSGNSMTFFRDNHTGKVYSLATPNPDALECGK